MNEINPYEPSQAMSYVPAQPAAHALGMLRGFLIVLIAGAGGALLGLIAGGLTGTYLPDYYRAVFDKPELDPVQIATGLGLTQGFGIGLAVGCIVLLAVALSRRQQSAASVQL
ncbi:MAG: hypothetical protein WD872_10445 [Pirellulaceae bacterium]